MPQPPRHRLDRNVPKDWRPVEGLAGRKPGMAFSDRVWHWLVSLGGLAVVGVGVCVFAGGGGVRAGAWIVGAGTVIFVLGFPSQAQRNGYRD